MHVELVIMTKFVCKNENQEWTNNMAWKFVLKSAYVLKRNSYMRQMCFQIKPELHIFKHTEKSNSYQ